MASLMKFLLAAADTTSESPVVESSLLTEMMSPSNFHLNFIEFSSFS